jgi:CHAT domain-containing protein
VLREQLVAGAKLFQTSQYEQAKEQFERVRRAASVPPDPYMQIRATANVGGCWFALHRYKLALKSFLAAQDMAEKTGDSSAAAALEANVASLYSEMGERDAAVTWLERSLAAWTGKERAAHLPQLEFEMASLRARQSRMSEARDLFRRGIDAASRAGDPSLVAVGWNKLGEELLRAGQTAAAEGPLLQAYYLRKLNRLPLEGSYTNLGKLRLAQGDLVSASSLLDLGVEASKRSPAAMPAWDAYLARGEVNLAQARYRNALENLRIAMRLARAWRWSLPADDASHVGAEGILDRIYSGLVEAGNRLYFETGDASLIRETFEASEENRAMSLRMLVQDRQDAATEFPPSYWEAVARLQHAEVSALRGGDQEAVHAARAEWIRMEASVSPDLAPLPAESLEKLRASLDSGTALLSVRLGASVSWIWAVDREGVGLYRLPPRAAIESVAASAAQAVHKNQLGSDAPLQLYRTLFEPLAPRFRNKNRWLLALDPGLLEIPVAALEIEGGVHPVYVAERHVVQIIPGAGFWLENASRRGRVETAGLFLGVGDPIYNMADSRLPQRPDARSRNVARWSLFADARPRDTALALPRLVGSGAEVERCARIWKGQSILLQGRNASGERVRETLRRNPAVVHFALHFLESSQPSPHGLMALGMGTGNQPELIAPVEVSHWRIRAGLVVLSGCDSAAGETLPGTGLMGLTRAWLTAGAQSVLASRWATPDEDGALFAAFYREYGNGNRVDAAAALGRAQARMIREGGWRARPAYWGAWFVVGN